MRSTLYESICLVRTVPRLPLNALKTWNWITPEHWRHQAPRYLVSAEVIHRGERGGQVQRRGVATTAIYVTARQANDDCFAQAYAKAAREAVVQVKIFQGPTPSPQPDGTVFSE